MADGTWFVLDEAGSAVEGKATVAAEGGEEESSGVAGGGGGY